MLPASWKPRLAAGLSRLGPANDGGYVVPLRAVESSSLLLSMGLNDDWRFEKAFGEASGAKMLVFDGSVDRRFWQLYAIKKVLRLKPHKAMHYFAYRRFFASARAEHRRQMIGYDGPGSVSLDTILSGVSDRAIFLKVDIEGWEYRILDQIVTHRDRFTGIVMELHDVDLQRHRITRFLEGMAGFTLVSLTPNNFGGTDASGDPIVVEITLVRDAFVTLDNTAPDASELAMVNDPGRANIDLRFAAG